MRRIATPLFLLAVLASPAAAAPDKSFSGSYKGQREGAAVVAIFSDQDRQLTGNLKIGTGETLRLDGVVDGNHATGRFKNTGGDGSFTATLKGDQLVIEMEKPETLFTEAESFTLELTRESPPPSAAPRKAPAAAPKPARTVLAIDNRLVGTWINTDVTDSQFAGADSVSLILGANGRFVYGPHRAALEDAGSVGENPSKPSSRPISGQWRTSGDGLYLLPDRTNKWNLWAHYSLQRGKLVTTDKEGLETYWKRR